MTSKGLLRKQNGGWVLETADGVEIERGSYPLVEDEQFVEKAAEKLIEEELSDLTVDSGRVPEHAATKRTVTISAGSKPYRIIDERDHS